ncbi:hypothetical protein CB1_001581006 [Camelus ferus]|nr:hypothetical protein CB1_001581006 [Camelus ferus]
MTLSIGGKQAPGNRYRSRQITGLKPPPFIPEKDPEELNFSGETTPSLALEADPVQPQTLVSTLPGLFGAAGIHEAWYKDPGDRAPRPPGLLLGGDTTSSKAFISSSAKGRR